ncbi:MAG: alr0857 family protein [Cyanobacteria bacterium P01_A01_bin.45]
MLKLTYTETTFNLECLSQSLEDWVQGRVILALRIGQSLCVEPSSASFLLPVDLPDIKQLQKEVEKDDREIITLCACDREYMEVSIQGSWLSYNCEDISGVFVTTIDNNIESFIYDLWLEARACTSLIGD